MRYYIITRDAEDNKVKQHLSAAESAAMDALRAPSTDPRDYPLTAWQFKAVVNQMGNANTIRTAINQLPDTLEGRHAAMAKFEHGTLFHRDHPLVAQVAQIIGMTEAEMDAKWLEAKDLT